MKGQLSLEFLLVLAAYLTFLLILILSYIEFFKRISEYEEKIFARARGELFSILYSLREINNKLQLFDARLEGCIVLEEEVICDGMVTKRQVPTMHGMRYRYEIV